MVITGLQLAQGEMIPRWYGIAYYSPYSDHAICYPIPVNLIVRWLRNLLWAMKRGKEDALSEAYRRGRTDLRSAEERESQRVARVISAIKCKPSS